MSLKVKSADMSSVVSNGAAAHRERTKERERVKNRERKQERDRRPPLATPLPPLLLLPPFSLPRSLPRTPQASKRSRIVYAPSFFPTLSLSLSVCALPFCSSEGEGEAHVGESSSLPLPLPPLPSPLPLPPGFFPLTQGRTMSDNNLKCEECQKIVGSKR